MSYLPNDLTALTTVSNTSIQQNDAALDNAISGNLTQANLSAATQIPNSMLASPNVEEILTFQVPYVNLATAATSGVRAVLRLAPAVTYSITAIAADGQLVGGAGSGTFNLTAGPSAGNQTINIATGISFAVGTTQTSPTALVSTLSGPTTLVLNQTGNFGTQPTGGALTVTLTITRKLQ